MRNILFLVALLMSIASSSTAQVKTTFQSEELRRVATELQLDSLDTLKMGSSVISKDGKRLVVRRVANGKVEHIGISLFPAEMRQQGNGTVMDFLESALLCNTFQLMQNKLKYVDVKFLKGSWQQMLKLSPTAVCTLGLIDGKAYQAVWSEDDVEKVNVVLPVKYDMILNVPRKELEHNFMRDLREYEDGACPVMCDIDVARLKMVRDLADTIYMLPGRHYNLETVTNATYYRLKDSVDYVPVVDAKYPVQTVANTVLLNCQQIPKAKVRLTLVASDKNNETATVSVRQLVGVAKQQGCVPYFSFESIEDGRFRGALFLYNKEAGYDHVLSLVCNVEDIASDNLVFESRAYLFTPTTNVKNLYEGIKAKKQ